ncbi:MAG: hypothetical protein QGH12_09215, partial [SAR324 cluster bacterium]|nr:hypothetical protein [SAR324 cluster bacterium]
MWRHRDWRNQRRWVAVVITLVLMGSLQNRLLAQQTTEVMGETLIMQTSSTKVEQSDGVFVVEVSAFEPFLVVKVNGFA